MKEFWNTIQLILTATGGWLGWFLGCCMVLTKSISRFARNTVTLLETGGAAARS